MLLHSPQFLIAMAIAMTEFWVESLLFPGFKQNLMITFIGFGIAICGQIIRSVAMWTAGSNFSHQIALHKKQNHKLVKSGIYKIFRHPSYFGWFWWSVSTQAILCNPLSIIAYTAASWYFFNERIPGEEETLLDFFGDDYVEYIKESWIGIPFISSSKTVALYENLKKKYSS
eukprot:TRINITY_DN25434_c0_g1_i1.p1 TRINITY_DN25434_c0_g1~~TRINITY_DN25434_c0_g1_i1.p1  ORF type:complete len:172 (-),score=33.76 TRINITY_DN25434_c0_g1_i1:126-641(-)